MKRQHFIYDKEELQKNFEYLLTFGTELPDDSTGQFSGITSRTFVLTGVDYEFAFEQDKLIALTITYNGLQAVQDWCNAYN